MNGTSSKASRSPAEQLQNFLDRVPFARKALSASSSAPTIAVPDEPAGHQRSR